MANLFLESFDNIDISVMPMKSYTSIDSFLNMSIGAGRTNNGIIIDAPGYPQRSLNKILPIGCNSVIFGCAFKTGSAFPIDQIIWSFADASFDHVLVWMDSAGRLKFTNRDGAVLGFSIPNIYARNSYYYFEFKIVFSISSVGSINYRVNGVSQPAITSVQTAYNGFNTCNVIRLWGRGAGIGSDAFPYFYDDMYANDTTGSDNNDYMGDVRIFVDRPAATVAGASQWALSGPSPKAVAVGDTTQDGDATYISSNTAGQVDLYTLAAPPSGLGTVKAVQTNLVARKDDGIIRQIAPVLGDGVHSNAVGASISIGNNYVDYLQSFDRNPLTGAVWSVGDLSTLQVGVKEIV